ncbi:MAG: hypothetical protein P9L92_06730 [Candidatus Electryonea clarkiae]|nr:hypothetical protein [Candidatus Electryonea clarkiae]
MQKYDEFIDKANQALSERTNDYSYLMTRMSNLLEQSCGSQSIQYIQYSKFITEEKRNVRYNPEFFSSALDIFRAAADDYRENLLDNLPMIVRAEVHEDFLEQGEYLLEIGYHIPAASLAGAVLEDTLRKIHEEKIGQVAKTTKIGNLNTALKKKGVINDTDHKLIIGYADIRNNADHGDFEKVEMDQVKLMVPGVRNIMSKYLG